MRSALYSRYFDACLTMLQKEVDTLYQEKTTRIDAEGARQKIVAYRGTWLNAYDGALDVKRADLLRYGLSLGRLAETFSFHVIAEEILNRLAESAIRHETWISDPASVLVTAGEFNRRRGNLNNAESRYNEAMSILEHDLSETEASGTHAFLGYVFYELAYLHRLRGDAGATHATLERSEIECDLGKDPVGAEIARILLAVITYEEGSPDVAVCQLTEGLSQIERLVDDPGIKQAKRSGLARRWVINAQLNLAQAQRALGNYEAARRLIESSRGEPSIVGQATLKRLEALLFLAEGELSAAKEAIGTSWRDIEQQGDLMSTELSAATVAIAGIIHGLEGSEESRSSALSCFEQACTFPPDNHNRTAQAWAWAGRAILAAAAGNTTASVAAIHKGLAGVQRCGAPIRAFLLKLLRNTFATNERSNLTDLKELVCRSG